MMCSRCGRSNSSCERYRRDHAGERTNERLPKWTSGDYHGVEYLGETVASSGIGEKKALQGSREGGIVFPMYLSLNPGLQGGMAWDMIAGKVCLIEISGFARMLMRGVCSDRGPEGGRCNIAHEEDGDLAGLPDIESGTGSQPAFGLGIPRPDVWRAGEAGVVGESQGSTTGLGAPLISATMG